MPFRIAASRFSRPPERKALGERIASGVSGTPVVLETLAHDYYDGLRFMISARAVNGAHMPLIDGGAFDWLRKLTSNNKLVFVASGLGSQLAAYLYRLPASARRVRISGAGRRPFRRANPAAAD